MKEQKIHIEMTYEEMEVNNNIKMEEYLVINRYRNIHYLLRSANKDSDRKINFQWKINIGKMKYSFCFDTSSENKNSFNMLSITKNEENIDLYDDKYK
jgi:hypothetical protein